MDNNSYYKDLFQIVDDHASELHGVENWGYNGMLTKGSASYLTWESNFGVLSARLTPKGILYNFKPRKPQPGNYGSGGVLPIRYSGELEQDFTRFFESMDCILKIIEGSAHGVVHGDDDLIPGGDKDLNPGWDHEDEPPAQTQTKPNKSWKDSSSEAEIVKLFPFRPSGDEILDLVQKAKELKSNKLMNLAKERSSRVESLTTEQQAEALVNQLLDCEAPPKPQHFSFKSKDVTSFKRKKPPIA